MLMSGQGVVAENGWAVRHHTGSGSRVDFLTGRAVKLAV